MFSDVTMTPFVTQFCFAGCLQLAALSVGGAVMYPSVLLQQLSSDESSMKLDLHTASWIGSIHGLAGILSIFVPSLMQWRGRKFAFIGMCIISIVGWILAFTATSTTMILISESFHGLGSNSYLSVSLLSMSEMIPPKYRTASMVSVYLVEALGMALMGIISRHLHWKTISLVMCAPMTVAMLMGCMWPESPSWLAWKGQFDKCEKAFVWLRGTDSSSKKELDDLIAAQKENLRSQTTTPKNLKYFCNSVKRKDFYVPCFHMFVLLNLAYWSGSIVILIYGAQIIEKVTQNENAIYFGSMSFNCILFVGMASSALLIRRFKNKNILLISCVCTSICLMSNVLINFLQVRGLISKDSLTCLYLLICFMISNSFGVLPIVYSVAAELMPVKYRGIGGGAYVIFTCVLHASSLKAAPYLLLHLDLWGTFLIYAANVVVCSVIVWRYVPETKGRTLQEIENYYATDSFRSKCYVSENVVLVNQNQNCV